MAKEQKERIRREYTADGQRGQKMMNFRCDLENIEWLNTKVNKGRYINELIEKDRKRNQRKE